MSMSELRCMCGDSECPSCGRAQVTYSGDDEARCLCGHSEGEHKHGYRQCGLCECVRYQPQ